MAVEMKTKCVEDEVQYRLYPACPKYITDESVNDYLQEQLDTFLIHLSNLIIPYVWQNESFQLTVIPGKGSCVAHLYGSTKFGDNVEDEWFIVYLLKCLTKEFDGLIAQVADNDGEFLLIEAADALPKWLSPDTSEHRVFLCNDKLHIVPQKYDVKSQYDGVCAVRINTMESLASNNIQKLMDKRLKGYPEKSTEHIHHTHCYIPTPLAAVLDEQPNLVAPMIHAFYYRDPIDLKACVTFQTFRPGTRIMRRVKMTRCLYAQLLQQDFQPDRRSGYTIPSSTHPHYKAQQIGTKLAHGAEILCSKCDYDGAVLTQHPRWQHYLAALSEKGYFRGELEGSQLYCKLLQDAKTFFSTSNSLQNSKKCGPGDQIMHILKKTEYDIEDMRKAEKNLLPPDDDSWIELTPESLDKMMNEAYGDAFQGTTTDLGKVADDMKSFINKVSSHEGAEFPKDDHQDIELDANSFIHTMQKMFDFKDEDKSSSDDMSEYGSDLEMEDSLTPSASSQSVSSSTQDSHDSHGNSSRNENQERNDLNIEDYMEMMDRELSRTTIGDSFMKEGTPEDLSKKPVPPPRRKKKNTSKPSVTTKPKTYPKPANKQQSKSDYNYASPSTSTPSNVKSRKETRKSVPHASSEDIDDLDEDFEPVNVDMNLVHNLLESYSSQQGVAGPAGNILGRMGLHLPPQDSGTSDDILD